MQPLVPGEYDRTHSAFLKLAVRILEHSKQGEAELDAAGWFPPVEPGRVFRSHLEDPGELRVTIIPAAPSVAPMAPFAVQFLVHRPYGSPDPESTRKPDRSERRRAGSGN
ncbi:MAG: hypothetical protein P8125_01280 [Gemmatimonadota bacterium]